MKVTGDIVDVVFSIMHNKLFWILLAVNIPVFILIGKLIFKNREGFLTAVKYYYIPDWVSLMSGEFWKDVWHSLKFSFFIILCVFLFIGEALLFYRWGFLK